MSDHSSYSYSSYELDGICLILSKKEVLHARVTDHWSLWINSKDRDEEQQWGIYLLQGTDGALEGLQRAQWESSEPVKSKWTVHVPDDMDNRAQCTAVPHLQLCVLPQRAALNSQVHIGHTLIINLEAHLQ